MKIVVAGGGRFFLFKEAAFFDRKGMLEVLISNYPKRIPISEGINKSRIRNISINGYLSYAIWRFFPKKILPRLFNILVYLIHSSFGLFVRRNVVRADIYLMLSSFACEAIPRIRKKTNAIVIIEHASFHQREERALVLEDAKHWGIDPPQAELSPDWVINKEDQEFNLADYILVPSEAAKRSLIKHKVPEDKVLVNAYGVDVSEFYPIEKTDDVFRVVQVGQASQRKGIYTSIEAFVNADIKNSELIFIGQSSYDQDVVNRLAAHRIDSISFLPPIPQRELVNVYGQASIMLMPSLADGFGLVVLQALACGCPVFASENVGASEYITNGKNGFVFKVRDTDALASHMLEVSRDPVLLSNMSANALSSVRTTLTWDDYCHRLESILNKILKDSI